MVLRSKLETFIKVSYKKKHDDLLAKMNTNINHDFGHGIMSQGTLTSGKLLAISLNKEMAVIQTEVTGKVEIINSFLSLKVMLPKFMSAPVVTLDCSAAPVAPKITLTVLPLGTTPPANVPSAAEAQLLDVPLDSAMAPRAPVTCPPNQ